MPSNLTPNEEEDHISVPDGTEHVLNIKRVSQNSQDDPKHMVNEPNVYTNKREFLQEDISSSMLVTSSSRREVQPRKGTQLGASLFHEVGRQKRVTSILEVDTPESTDARTNGNRVTTSAIIRPLGCDFIHISESGDDAKVYQSGFDPSTKQMHRQYHVKEVNETEETMSKTYASERSDLAHSDIRYSNIFAAELSRKHKNKRVPWRHRGLSKTSGKSKSMPCNCSIDHSSHTCGQHICGRCHSHMSLEELKQSTYERNSVHSRTFDHPTGISNNDAGSMDNLYHHHGNNRSHLLSSGKHHKHYNLPEHRRFVTSHSSENVSHGHHMHKSMYSSDAINDLYRSTSMLNQNTDLLEIEYEEATKPQDEDDPTYLTPGKIDVIVKLATNITMESENDPDKTAKVTKFALDDKLGEAWHVVVSDEAYGSSIASLPGALVSFKAGKNVYLVWRT